MITNDIAAAPGLCVSFFTQGCPHRCHGCHNPETWAFDGGEEFTPEVLDKIIEALNAQGIKRKFCLMGGEPLCQENEFLSYLIISTIKDRSPETEIYIWSGYYYDELLKNSSIKVKQILALADYLVDGPYIENQRNLTLEMRGSENQSIIKLHD